MAQDLIEPFADICDNPDYARMLAEKGKKPVLGYLCNYTPVELIHACGFTPVRLTGGPGGVEKAYDLLPDFVCPFLKRVTERILQEGYAFISGIVDAYTCDASCGVARVLARNLAGKPVEIISLPYTDGDDARKYLKNVLFDLVKKLEKAGGRFSMEALGSSIELYSSIRRIICSLYELMYQQKLPLSPAELWCVIRAGELAPPEMYLEMLIRLEKDIRLKPAPRNDGIPVMISGSLVEGSEIFTLIEDCGGKIVADDLCTGLRIPGWISPAAGDPMKRLVEGFFKRTPCPSRARAKQRLPVLEKMIKRSNARGVVFLHQKFCTPHLADYPYLSGALARNNTRCIQIETDETWKASGQVRTRLESFFEMLAGP